MRHEWLAKRILGWVFLRAMLLMSLLRRCSAACFLGKPKMYLAKAIGSPMDRM